MSTFSGLINSEDGWVRISLGDASFTIEISHSGYDVFVILSNTEPTTETYGHRVEKGNRFSIANSEFGTAWIRTDAPDDVLYVVTTNGPTGD